MWNSFTRMSVCRYMVNIFITILVLTNLTMLHTPTLNPWIAETDRFRHNHVSFVLTGVPYQRTMPFAAPKNIKLNEKVTYVTQKLDPCFKRSSCGFITPSGSLSIAIINFCLCIQWWNFHYRCSIWYNKKFHCNNLIFIQVKNHIQCKLYTNSSMNELQIVKCSKPSTSTTVLIRRFITNFDTI